MAKLTRRDCIQGTLTSLAAASATPAAASRVVPPRKSLPVKSGGIQFTEILLPGEKKRMRLARQIGITNAIVTVTGALAKVRREEYVDTLAKIKDEFQAEGLTILGVESSPVPSEKLKLATPGRDEEIENYKAAIDALSKVGINMICWNFMVGLSWYRTRFNAPERGGALTTEFDNRIAKAEGLTKWGEISEEKVWANMEYFLKAIIPVAEKAKVKMALHPDDPPLSPLRGIGRICVSAKNFRRVMDTVPSPFNGVTFCQANFKAMGEDIEALAREWSQKRKIFFVHFRDIEGQGEYFRETFHDNGPTDMARMLKVYSESGFSGPMRPDHAPTLDGEANDRPGYAMEGKILAIGYMRGIMDALNLPYA